MYYRVTIYANGHPTGIWSRLSDNSSMLEVMVYDHLGNLCLTKVYRPFGYGANTTTEYHNSGSRAKVKYAEGDIDYILVNTSIYSNCSIHESNLTPNNSTNKQTPVILNLNL